VSAYVSPECQRQGLGKALYGRLFDDLIDRGFCTAFAGITVPNDASIGLHRSVGFEHIGAFRRIGWKFGRWHDVVWMQRRLRDAPP
jgi:phosphinothricin acetyltransferase